MIAASQSFFRATDLLDLGVFDVGEVEIRRGGGPLKCQSSSGAEGKSRWDDEIESFFDHFISEEENWKKVDEFSREE